MAFKNELVSAEDIRKYDLVEIFEEFLPRTIEEDPGVKTQWTADREREMFLFKYRGGYSVDVNTSYWCLIIKGISRSITLKKTYPIDGKTGCKWYLVSLGEPSESISRDEVISYLKEALVTYGMMGATRPTPKNYQVEFNF